MANPDHIRTYIDWAASSLWILSAVLWITATYVSRRPQGKDKDKDKDKRDWEPPAITDNDKDLLGTAERQVKWNRYAAFAAALAAALQGIAPWLNY